MSPRLTIIAGPNGAGKSLFSSTLVSIDAEIFDGDKYLTKLKKEFPETGSFQLNSYVNEHYFIIAKEKAITKDSDFAFETNFSSDDPLTTFYQFKKTGYKTHLIFIGMSLVEDCIQRVLI